MWVKGGVLWGGDARRGSHTCIHLCLRGSITQPLCCIPVAAFMRLTCDFLRWLNESLPADALVLRQCLSLKKFSIGPPGPSGLSVLFRTCAMCASGSMSLLLKAERSVVGTKEDGFFKRGISGQEFVIAAGWCGAPTVAGATLELRGTQAEAGMVRVVARDSYSLQWVFVSG